MEEIRSAQSQPCGDVKNTAGEAEPSAAYRRALEADARALLQRSYYDPRAKRVAEGCLSLLCQLNGAAASVGDSGLVYRNPAPHAAAALTTGATKFFTGALSSGLPSPKSGPPPSADTPAADDLK